LAEVRVDRVRQDLSEAVELRQLVGRLLALRRLIIGLSGRVRFLAAGRVGKAPRFAWRSPSANPSRLWRAQGPALRTRLTPGIWRS